MPNGASSIVGRVTEKLGRWLTHHESRSDLSISLDLHNRRIRNVDSNSFSSIFASQQTSNFDELGTMGSSTVVGADAPNLRHHGGTVNALPTTTAQPSATSLTGNSNRPHYQPPLSELFHPQSMFHADSECETPVVAGTPSSSLPPSDRVRQGNDSVSSPSVVSRSPDLLTNSFRYVTGGSKRDETSPAGTVDLLVKQIANRPVTLPTNHSRAFIVERTDFGGGGTQPPEIPNRNVELGQHTMGGYDKLIGPLSCDEASGPALCDDQSSTSRVNMECLPSAAEVLHSNPTPVVSSDDKLAALSSCQCEEDNIQIHKPETSFSSQDSSMNIDLYERPESHQCTVTSLTPLLRDGGTDEDDNVEDNVATTTCS